MITIFLHFTCSLVKIFHINRVYHVVIALAMTATKPGQFNCIGSLVRKGKCLHPFKTYWFPFGVFFKGPMISIPTRLQTSGFTGMG